MFYFEEIHGKKILKSDLLKNLKHCFTTRETVIRGNNNNTEQNTELICEYFEVKPENLISPAQTHSTNIAVANENQTDYPNTDAIILTNKNQAVYLNFADCTPIILYDEVLNIGAVVHAGWRGTAGAIVQKTVNMLFNNFNSRPENILSAIGPAIGQCCYCVDKDVANKLANTINDFHDTFNYVNDKIYVDLKEINRRQLLACGVKKIDLCNYCTSCANELFFSYRKENRSDNTLQNRHSAIIKLN